MQTAVRRVENRSRKQSSKQSSRGRLVTLPLAFLDPSEETEGWVGGSRAEAISVAPGEASGVEDPGVLVRRERVLDVFSDEEASLETPVSEASSKQAQLHKQALVQQLAREVRQLEVSRRMVPVGSTSGPVFSCGCRELDRCLPLGGYESGSIVEYVQSDLASGASTLVLSAVRSILSATERFCVVIDSHQQIYPPAMEAMGIDLRRTIVIRPRTLADRLWAMDQALRSPAIGAVVGEVDRLDDRSARRLQLAAECGGGVGLLIRGEVACRCPSWAEIQWRVFSKAWDGPMAAQATPLSRSSEESGALGEPRGMDRELFVQLVRVRGGEPGATLRVSISGIDGTLRAVPVRLAARSKEMRTSLSNDGRRANSHSVTHVSGANGARILPARTKNRNAS